MQTDLGAHPYMTLICTEICKLAIFLQVHATERKERVHARKFDKSFTCSLEQHLWKAGNILCFVLLAMHSDLNSHFKKLNTSNTSLTLEECHKPKHALHPVGACKFELNEASSVISYFIS